MDRLRISFFFFYYLFISDNLIQERKQSLRYTDIHNIYNKTVFVISNENNKSDECARDWEKEKSAGKRLRDRKCNDKIIKKKKKIVIAINKAVAKKSWMASRVIEKVIIRIRGDGNCDAK